MLKELSFDNEIKNETFCSFKMSHSSSSRLDVVVAVSYSSVHLLQFVYLNTVN